MKFSIKRRSVVMTWLISYISVLLVPILIAGSIYSVAMRIVENEINRSNESLLSSIKEAADNRLRDLDQLGLQVSRSQQVLDFINQDVPLSDDAHYQILTIAKGLSVYKLANKYIDQVYVYYKRSDLMLSDQGWINSRSFYEQYRPQMTMSYGEWKSFYDQRYVKGYFPVLKFAADADPVSSIMYVRSAVLQNPDMPGAMIMFVFDGNKLLENLDTNQLDRSSYIMVLDRQDRLIASTNPSIRAPIVSYRSLQGANGVQHETKSGEKMTVSYTASEITGWKYISVTPYKVFFNKLEYLRELTYVSMVLCLIIGGLITYYSLKKNYNPIHALILSLSEKTGISFERKINEYQFIQEAVNDTVEEKEEIYLRLKRHHSTIRSSFLRRLLKGSIRAGAPIPESLAEHDITFIGTDFAVLLFHIESLGKLDTSDEFDQANNIRLVHFVLTNVVEELARHHYPAYMVETDDMLACIVNSAEGTEQSVKLELLNIAEQAKTFMFEKIHVNLTAAVSDVHSEIYSIPQAYQEAVEAIEYRVVMGRGEIIDYRRIADTGQHNKRRYYYYPLNVEQQLINLVKIADYEKASAVFDQIIEYNFANTFISVQIARCLMFNFISTMMKTIDEINSISKGDFLETIKPVDRLLNCQSIQEMQLKMKEVLKEVCEYIRSDREQETFRLCEKVAAFICEHYSNPDLNISMIGQHFGLTPSYLSRLFREETGDALLDLINKSRLNEAKRLLAAQNYTVSDISRMVGYNEVNTFNRIFKKFEGVTPGKYKELG